MTRVHAVIHGRVQGVGFRDFTLQVARAQHLNGWVRNRRDGTVEAVLEGSGEAIDSVLALLRQGPEHAAVTDIASRPHPESVAAGFEVRPTF